MPTQEVTFASGTIRIDVEPEFLDSTPRFCARLSYVDEEREEERVVVWPDGTRVAIHGETELLALNSAVTFLEAHFGPPAQTGDQPVVRRGPLGTGTPLVLENGDHGHHGGGASGASDGETRIGAH